MKEGPKIPIKCVLLITLVVLLAGLSIPLRADTGMCGGQMITIPFTDVSPASVFFCSIAEAFFSGLTNGTTPTTYSPSDPVLREQMAAFVTRTLDQSLKRGSRRAALGQFWTVSKEPSASFVSLLGLVLSIKSDGTDVYFANFTANVLTKFVASGSQSLEKPALYTGVVNPTGIAITSNFVYVTGDTNPGRLYRVGRQAPSMTEAELLTSNLGGKPTGIAYDGERIWTTNLGGDSVSIYNPTTTTTTTIAPSFSTPYGILYDGANIWVTNFANGTLVKLNQNGTSILQTVTVGAGPSLPMFDGTNIWVPNTQDNSISVVRAATGQVLATLTGNGLNYPVEIAFDGQRVMVTNYLGDSLSLWKATDLTPLGSISVGFPTSGPFNVCSDGQDFWVTLRSDGAGGGSTIKKY